MKVRKAFYLPITSLYLQINDLLDEPEHVTKTSAIPEIPKISAITNAQLMGSLIDRDKLSNQETPYIIEF